MDLDQAKQTASTLLPELVDELKALVNIASVSSPAFPKEPVLEAGSAVVDFLQRCGATDARLLEIPDGYPAVFAEVPADRPDAPTVLLYAHYDVQPAPRDQGWDTDPFVAHVGDDGRIYGRGAADDKSGIVIHGGVLKAFAGKPPVNLKILIEGEEESDSHLETFVADHPELVAADLFVVADMGNPRVGQPALTTALRGVASCTVRVKTLDHPLHSGLFGGAAPDALLALIQLLGKLHDDEGNVVVPGLANFAWTGAEVEEGEFRENAAVLNGVSLVGSDSIAARLWSKSSLTVIGIDAPTVAEASNILIPEASAYLSLRVPPGADPREELATLTAFLEAHVPWGAHLEVEPSHLGEPFAVNTDHPMVRVAAQALTDAYGVTSETAGAGGSIPLVAALQNASPDAGVVLWGAEDTAQARIHASNESVDPSEIEHTVTAEILLLSRL